MTHNERKATKEATSIYFKEHESIQTNELADTGLVISQAGFGSYRIDNDSPDYKTALTKALENGINIIDTSTNYGNGGSEKCIGEVLADCERRDTVRRNQVVIVSKAGYVQGDLYEESQQRKRTNTGFSELVEFDDGLEHCIHPEFLAEQITNSLDRLGTDCIDVFLLHNPEYYKFKAQKDGHDLQHINDEYYFRIRKAFDYLEEEVAAGRIQCYGISSNTFAYDPSHPDATDLNKVLELSDKHNHFKVIQCPLNLFEHQAVYPQEHSVVSIAKANNIAVLTNRPFNAIFKHQLCRLTEVPDQEEIALIEVDDCLEEGLLQEADMKKRLEELEFNEQLLEYFQLFALLKQQFVDELNLFDFKQMVSHTFYPLISQLVHVMAEQAYELETNELFEQYIRNVNLSIRFIINYLSNKQNSKMADVKGAIYEQCPELAYNYRLSNVLLRLYRSTEGISSVLVGMRQDDYVDSVLDELSEAKYEKVNDFWKNVSHIHQHVIY